MVKELIKLYFTLLATIQYYDNERLHYEMIKRILQNFSNILTGSLTREQQKKLLHMIISEITINELREINSIKIKIDDNLVDYLSKEEGVSVMGAPSLVECRYVQGKIELQITI